MPTVFTVTNRSNKRIELVLALTEQRARTIPIPSGGSVDIPIEDDPDAAVVAKRSDAVESVLKRYGRSIAYFKQEGLI